MREESFDTVELLRWLARRRRPADLRNDDGDKLADALGAERGQPHQIQARIDGAIESMPDGPHKAAAGWLVGSGHLRWHALKSRQHEAAKQFGVKADAFRRKRSDGSPSRENEVLAELAFAIAADQNKGDFVEVLPASAEHPIRQSSEATVDLTPKGAQHGGGQAPDSKTGWRRQPSVIVAVVVLAVLSIGAASRVLPGRFGRPSLAAPTVVDGCLYEAGEGDSFGNATIATTYDSGGGEAAFGCALTPVERLPNSPLYFQEFGQAGRTPEQVVVALDDGGSLTVPFAAWGSYRQIGGKSGDNAHSIAGTPVGLRVTGAAAYLELDSDVQLVAEAEEAPYFFVVAPAGAAWAERGGANGEMGLPTSNLYVRDGRWRQEFETGWLETEDLDGSITWNPAGSPDSELPDNDLMSGRIIGQLDGTAWFVTGDLKRKWIPDGLVWDCLGGSAEAVATDVPGYSVAQLPYAGLATCDDSRLAPLDLSQHCVRQLGPGTVARATADPPDGWECGSTDGDVERIDLEQLCVDSHDDDRALVSTNPGDPLAWRCAAADWQPLPLQ